MHVIFRSVYVSEAQISPFIHLSTSDVRRLSMLNTPASFPFVSEVKVFLSLWRVIFLPLSISSQNHSVFLPDRRNSLKDIRESSSSLSIHTGLRLLCGWKHSADLSEHSGEQFVSKDSISPTVCLKLLECSRWRRDSRYIHMHKT